MITTDLKTWLLGLSGLTPLFAPTDGSVPVYVSAEPGYQTPNISGRMITPTVTGGQPTQLERVLDVHTVQLMIRGAQADPVGTETMVALVDNTIMGLKPPFVVGSQHCVDLDYIGGPPRWLVRDPARRHHWACNYYLTVARTTF
jgi:hypothetical protein